MQRTRILQTFGAAVRRERKALGLSQERLAQKAGVDRTYIGMVERGERNLSLMNIVRISRALGVHPTKLLGDLVLGGR